MAVAALYPRVSTDKQVAENQLPELRQLAAARGYEAVLWEETESAMKKRPVLDRLLAGGSSLALVDEDGVVTYANNWLPTGWMGSHGTVAGTLTDAGGNLTGSAPGFVDAAGRDFRLATDPASPCIGAAGVLPSQTTAMPLEVMYVPHQQTTSKSGQVPSDLGAFWAGGGTPPPPPHPVTPPSTPASGGGAKGGCGLGADPGSGWLALAGLAALRCRQVRRAGAAPALSRELASSALITATLVWSPRMPT